ncbi:uncharacterized protein LOC125009578 [Mugil cephalus]|uniref:uncharacterized protein LOC125009578 n=1 Tax=Mugil cephalus TaxID=48193 RepID=UPI001FB7F27A|nr:uncharacterized protein LOC125009578 [Mugil cephalus]
MKMILTLTLIGMLFSTTEGLLCYVTDDEDNTKIGYCGYGDVCATVANRVVISGEAVKESVTKTCMSPFFCKERTFKVGSFISASSTHCCSTPLCNNHDVPYPDVTTENDMQCISCSGPLDTECQPIQCVGTQDHCFESYTKDANHLRGCASAGFCQPLFQLRLARLNSASKCCTTSFCNLGWNNKRRDDTEVVTDPPDCGSAGGCDDLHQADPVDEPSETRCSGSGLCNSVQDDEPSDDTEVVTERLSHSAYVDQSSNTNSARKFKLSVVPLLLGLVVVY